MAQSASSEAVADRELEHERLLAQRVERGRTQAVEREAPFEAQRADRRLPAEPEAQRVPQIPEAPGRARVRLAQETGLGLVAVLRFRVERVSDVEEEHPFDVRRRNDHELELQVERGQEVATDPVGDEPARGIRTLRDLDARPERAIAEPAEATIAVDAAGEEALDDRHALLLGVVHVPDLEPRLEHEPRAERLLGANDREIEATVEEIAIVPVLRAEVLARELAA